jgi:hypothetical protein
LAINSNWRSLPTSTTYRGILVIPSHDQYLEYLFDEGVNTESGNSPLRKQSSRLVQMEKGSLEPNYQSFVYRIKKHHPPEAVIHFDLKNSLCLGLGAFSMGGMSQSSVNHFE